MKAIIYNGRETNKKFDDIIGNATFQHAALQRGYISRKNVECVIEDYDGKFGRGFKVAYPNYWSTRYIGVSYFIFED